MGDGPRVVLGLGTFTASGWARSFRWHCPGAGWSKLVAKAEEGIRALGFWIQDFWSLEGCGSGWVKGPGYGEGVGLHVQDLVAKPE